MTARQELARHWRKREAEACEKVRASKTKKAVHKWTQEAKDCAANARLHEG